MGEKLVIERTKEVKLDTVPTLVNLYADLVGFTQV